MASSIFFSGAEPRATLMKISLPTEGITKTVLAAPNDHVYDLRSKLIVKIGKSGASNMDGWGFLMTKEADQLWLDDKAYLRAYHFKDGDTVEFKPRHKDWRPLVRQSSNVGPWVKAAPKAPAAFDHQNDKSSLSVSFNAPPVNVPISERPLHASVPISSPIAKPSLEKRRSRRDSRKARPRTNSTSKRDSINEMKFLEDFFSEKTAPPRAPSPANLSHLESIKNRLQERRNAELESGQQQSDSNLRLITPTGKNSQFDISKNTPEQSAGNTEQDLSLKSVSPRIKTTPVVHELFEQTELSLPVTLSASSENHTSPRAFEPSPLSHHNSTLASPRQPDPKPQLEINEQDEMKFLEEFFSEKKPPSQPSKESATATPPIQKAKEEEPQAPIQTTYTKMLDKALKPDLKEERRRSRRRSRPGSAARLSLVVKRANDIETQFNSYFDTLTQKLDQTEGKLLSVQDLLFKIVEGIDSGEFSLLRVRKLARDAIDLCVLDDEQNAS